MAEYTDADVPMKCGECDMLIEGIPEMVQHVITTHPNYTLEEAEEYVRSWADSAYEDIDLWNMRMTEEYRRNHRG